MPSTATATASATVVQSRIAAFESLNHPFLSKKPASPSPSPPNLGRKSSLIDLKDWIVEDGPLSPRTNRFNDGYSPSRPLIHLESPPPTTSAPPLPPRKLPHSTLQVADHTYPPIKIDTAARSSGHAPASSISSFHSVSLSSDTDPSTPGSVSSTFISSFPVDYDRDHNYDHEPDSVSLTESYEEVPTPLITSPATERLISLDWEKALATPPKLPQRPSPTAYSSASPTTRQSPSSSTPGSPAFKSSLSSVSLATAGSSATGRRPPPLPPSRAPDRSSIQSTATARSVASSNSLSSQGHTPKPYNPKLKRPTPVPAAARGRYESVFNANVIQHRKAEKQKAKQMPALLSVTEARGTRRAAGWRGLSVDLITAGHDIPAPPPPSGEDEEDINQLVESNETLEGYLVKTIWRRSKLGQSRLSEIWNECDPGGTGSLTRDGFVKGMWRIDEELRRVQTHALRSGSNPSQSSLRGKGSFKPPVPKRKPILR